MPREFSFLLALAFGLGLALAAHRAAAATLPEPPPGFRIGFELELILDRAARLTPFFDFQALQNGHDHSLLIRAQAFFSKFHGGDITDGYLRDYPEGEKRLPAKLRAQLAQGLSWEAVPVEDRYELVQWEHLAPRAKAALAWVAGSSLEAKTGLPTEASALGSRVDWVRDQDMFELKYNDDVPVRDARLMLDDLRNLARLTELEQEVLAQGGRKVKGAPQWGSLHYHVSVAGKDFTKLAPVINDLLLVRRLKSGMTDDLLPRSSDGVITYDPDVRLRGLIRLIGRDRIEFRIHEKPLEEALQERLGWLFAPDPAAKAQDLSREVSSLIDESVIDLVLRHRPEMIRHLRGYLSPQQRRTVLERLRCARGFAGLPKP